VRQNTQVISSIIFQEKIFQVKSGRSDEVSVDEGLSIIVVNLNRHRECK